jgi:hypothetical protein
VRIESLISLELTSLYWKRAEISKGGSDMLSRYWEAGPLRLSPKILRFLLMPTRQIDRSKLSAAATTTNANNDGCQTFHVAEIGRAWVTRLIMLTLSPSLIASPMHGFPSPIPARISSGLPTRPDYLKQ